ncbi:hypothetical protein Lqui_1516 [Legionella quinlivanii]|uniref:Uncharacterized protein n=1 Tax=Legionella quinlivanii TaxID=45073 RepID=A0A0W0Y0H2_9GAMM|nr:hypothetical protein [Legionella quinlivanii]KTD50191.1 hypothetical protein Lqui_1516 [Legionella quinlivanii]MCW8450064.1 hypothetical protein [Legionella quinlivanii]SEF48082.1 hypothetical protein SAMN02746093_00321 [Legionella quinlivanii DSM 21216]STY11789.1 Uncharacterised protein [Legionella quinlivanii]
MSQLSRFKKSSNKIEFLTDPYLDKAFYDDLCAMSKEEREQYANEIVEQIKHDGGMELLIIRLTDLCFEAKGEKFIRADSGDFFANILLKIIKELDGDAFAKAYQESNIKNAYPKDYAFNEKIDQILNIIRSIAARKGELHQQYLYSNLAIKIFNSLIMEGIVNPQELAPLQQIIANKTALDEYFTTHLSDPKDFSAGVEPYFEAQTKAQDEKEELHNNAIQNIKQLIRSKPWSIPGFLFIRGGVDMNVDGRTLRVPHRVAEMARAIETYEAKQNKTENDLYDLYEQIKDIAQEALDNPRQGRQPSTTKFYNDVLENVYRARDVNLVNTNEDDRARLLGLD